MDFENLRTFLEVSRLKSFSRAAQKLLRTQPAISAQIRTLEQEVGARLFERDGGKVTFTDGPFTEAKEIVGGLSIFTAASKEDAIALTTKLMAASEGDAECEVRQLYDMPAA